MESTMRHVIALAAILPVFALAASAASAADNGKYCLKGPGTTMNCTYQTMASCDKAKKGTETCIDNPANTTGSGTSGSMGSPIKK
jgi:Protein of unknown function (DUF3551)